MTPDRSTDDAIPNEGGLTRVWFLPLIEDATPMGQLQHEIREAWTAIFKLALAPPHAE